MQFQIAGIDLDAVVTGNSRPFRYTHDRPYMDTSRFASKNHLWFLGTTAQVYPTC